ncbi:UPF0696 protein C11orf68 homolog [Palaemon carinicauda]|uniref:UPF0696 protein C11orf68 homolog n=1 Tax=Palaemon carinicauda TaxID=392227 RepID=UPI0035B5868F
MAEGCVMKDEPDYTSETDDEDDDGCECTFDASVEDMSTFDTFLQMYKPSVVKRSDGIRWIGVKGPKFDDEYIEPALLELLEDWEVMQKTCQKITPNAIFEMAKKHNCLCGKWLIHKGTGIKIDLAWAAIARAVALGQCGISAKVSTIDDAERIYMGKTVVCVYNADFTDLEAVEKLDNDIREAGIKCSISYKPDVYTYLDIYQNNEWAIKPTIYTSQFDLVSGKSKIVATFGNQV